MESSRACLSASEKAVHELDLFPVILQRTPEKLKNSIVEAVLKDFKLVPWLRPNKVKD